MKKNGPGLADLLESFFRKRLIVQRRASHATVASYRDALRLLLTFISEKAGKALSDLAVGDIDRDMVLAFLDHLEAARGNGARTRNARLAAVRSFFRHVASSDPASMGVAQRVLAIEGKRTIKRVPHCLRHDELDAVVAAPDRSTPLGRRDHALLLFLGWTGARVSEAVGVNASDLRLERPWQVLLRGKGSKERVIPLTEDTAAVLRALCEERGISTDDAAPVFVNTRGQRLTRHGAHRIVRRAAAVASKACPSLASRAVSPHTLRHTAAMRLLQSGVDLAVIAAWLGHVSLDTTHGYVEADVEMKRRALEKCEAPETQLNCYQPTDAVLALLESL
jgi:site-specific recombinase XerD